MSRRAITKEEINKLPLRHYTGVIHVVDSRSRMDKAASALQAETVLGFDIETRPAFSAGEAYLPSLLQLAASESVYLFQLGRIGSFKALRRLLSDRQIVKAGVSVSDDIKKLNEVFPFKPGGFVELAHMAAEAGIKNAGVRGLAALLFGFRISKSNKCSRWDSPKLGRAQIFYAATDAWACRRIYFALSGPAHGGAGR